MPRLEQNDFASRRVNYQRRTLLAGVGAYEYRSGWVTREEVVVPAAKYGATLMFEDFAAMVGNPQRLEASIRVSERTQAWLEAFWQSALENEASGKPA